MTNSINWEALAKEYAGLLMWTAQNIRAKGTGCVFNQDTETTCTWQEFILKPVEKMPGVKIDWEVVEAYSLPPAERRKWMKKRIKEQK